MVEVDYGYGDAAPVDYGYGDATPDYGYGDASPDDNSNKTTSTSTADDYGYGDCDGGAPAVPQQERRPRRRCSITKYSLEAQEEVKQIFDEDGPTNAVSPSEEMAASSLLNKAQTSDEEEESAPKRGEKQKKRRFWKRRAPSRTKTM